MKNIFKKSTEKEAKAKPVTKTEKAVKPTTTPAPRRVDSDLEEQQTVAVVPSNTPAYTPPNPNVLQMPNNWAQKTLRLKANYPTLADMNFSAGGMEQVLTRIQVKLGKTRAEVEQIIAAL